MENFSARYPELRFREPVPSSRGLQAEFSGLSVRKDVRP